MRFTYGKQDARTLERAQETGFLLTNGLGGYASTTAAFSTPRADQAILAAALRAPNERISLVHRLSETLSIGKKEVFLSSQEFSDGRKAEDGYRYLTGFTYEYTPEWIYRVGGVQVRRQCAMACEKNTSAVLYTIENRDQVPCTLDVTPYLKFAPKETALERLDRTYTYENGKVTSGDYT